MAVACLFVEKESKGQFWHKLIEINAIKHENRVHGNNEVQNVFMSLQKISIEVINVEITN